MKVWFRNHTNQSLRLRAKTKTFFDDVKERIKAHRKPTTRTRVHQPIEIFSQLYYAGALTDKVNQITREGTPQLGVDEEGLPITETREQLTQRRLIVYRRVVGEAWGNASQDVKNEVDAILQEERQAAKQRKDAIEEEDDEEDERDERSPESYLE